MVLCAIAVGWLGLRSQQTALGQGLDQIGMDVVVGDESTTRRLVGVLGTVSVGSVVVVVGVLVIVALVRGRYPSAAAALLLVAGANVTTQLLKLTIDRPDFGLLTVPSFPSGHATVVVSLVLASLLVVPAPLRRTVTVLGSAAVTVTGAATLVASWHRPADVLGAVLVCLAWGAAVVAAWSLVRRGVPRPAQPVHRTASLVGVVLASAGLVVIGVRPGGGVSGLVDAGVVLGGIGLAAALAVSAFASLSAPMAVGAEGHPEASTDRSTAAPGG